MKYKLTPLYLCLGVPLSATPLVGALPVRGSPPASSTADTIKSKSVPDARLAAKIDMIAKGVGIVVLKPVSQIVTAVNRPVIT